MSEAVENVSEQNSAQSNEAAASQSDAVTNNVAADKAVPETVKTTVAKADDSASKDVPEKSSTSPKVDNKKTPAKRTPSKRMSHIERNQKESEELVKNMGGSLEIEGGRKTRSSTRGTPTRSAIASTSPPTKKSRSSPASGSSTPTRPKARGRKIEVADDATEEEANKHTPSKKKTPTKGKKTAAKKTAQEEEEEKVEKKEKEEEEKSEKTEEKPEEKEEKQVPTDTNLVAEKSIETTASSSEQQNEIEKSEENKTLEAPKVIEEVDSQLTAELKSTGKNVTKDPEHKIISADVVLELSDSVKSDSPMDTVEIIEENSKDDEHQPKESAPEPMEIDSSPNTDNDVVEISDDVEVVPESNKILDTPQPASTLKNQKVDELLTNNIEKVEKNSIENAVKVSPVVPTTTVAEIRDNSNSIEKPAAIADDASVNVISSEETTPANNEATKNENNLSEPKIATSPITTSAANDNGNVTTPQTCN